MIVVHIGNEQRELQDADEQWINQQIEARRKAGENVCVRVRIQEPSLDLVLSTPTCASSGGGGRQASTAEQRIIELWNQRGLNGNDFTGGQLIAFLKQVA